MTTKTKPAVPPPQALKEVAAVLARHSAKRAMQGDDAVSAEVVRSGASHLKTARERFHATVKIRRKVIAA
jgi:hypothetical protein